MADTTSATRLLAVDKKQLWDAWNLGGGPQYPHEKVVQFVFRSFPKTGRGNIRILDLGCGSGVHTQFLASEGFLTYARDLSQVGVSNTRSRLRSHGLSADVECGTVSSIDFPENYFDCVISIGVLDCAGPALFPTAVREVIRVLKPGSLALLIFASDKDHRICGGTPYNLHGFTDEEVESVRRTVLAQLDYFWMDRYITTHEDKAIQQNDHLLSLKKTKK